MMPRGGSLHDMYWLVGVRLGVVGVFITQHLLGWDGYERELSQGAGVVGKEDVEGGGG